jgi:NADPH:quinone reductase-like Zn-dependent oxidoreductase
VQAVVIREFGGPAVLRPDTFPEPAERPGWVVVKLRAAALNWHDVLVRQGRYVSPLPHVIGADGARGAARYGRGRRDRSFALLG